MTIFRDWDTFPELFSATRLYSPLSVLDTSLMIRTHRLPEWCTARRLDGTTAVSPRIHLQDGAGFPEISASTLSLAPALAPTISGMTIFGSPSGGNNRIRLIRFHRSSSTIIHRHHQYLSMHSLVHCSYWFYVITYTSVPWFPLAPGSRWTSSCPWSSWLPL